ncbi:fucosyltransferase 1 [Perilla frutescens var. hirtella]|uniref:Fucosyltransferase n=1 Tax=Perilla frutescens var. hirtella TaxID=608512 RepID=A0AAD4IS32_PERFH|nr:fucosyltransferase 1 [Perilla frutescens var. hirtella]
MNMPNKATPDAVTGGFNLMKFMCVFLISVIGFSGFLVRDPLSNELWTVVQVRNLYFKLKKAMLEESDGIEVGKDKLLPTGFDDKSCLSRYQSLLYHRGSTRRTPSPHLISKLRSYEARHKRCSPYTDSYNKTVNYLLQQSEGEVYSSTFNCKYVVWISMNGLGNQMLSMASTFLYALLTDRVLLLDRGVDIPDLFCEPFPEASWFLPSDFPFTSDDFNSFNQRSDKSYGNLLRSNVNTTTSAPRPYMHLYLAYDYDDADKRFFCDEDQTYLHNIPWLLMKSDGYYVPSLFSMPSFQQDLQTFFPEKDAIFHLLSRYLFHPTNSVWGLVTRYYDAYLSKADVITGIQVRVFDGEPGNPFKHVMDQILNCTKRENILPQIKENHYQSTSNLKNITVAVLMTSLSSGYYEQMREMYLQNPTTAGEAVGVFQPSHEEFQQTEKHSHNQKALAEIYLLSLTDKLVTSGWSTFGYVAQGIGGLKPWILYRPENRVAPEPPCERAKSMEPCYHGPPANDCKLRIGGVEKGALVPHVSHCEDVSWGLKLVQQNQPHSIVNQ